MRIIALLIGAPQETQASGSRWPPTKGAVDARVAHEELLPRRSRLGGAGDTLRSFSRMQLDTLDRPDEHRKRFRHLFEAA